MTVFVQDYDTPDRATMRDTSMWSIWPNILVVVSGVSGVSEKIIVLVVGVVAFSSRLIIGRELINVLIILILSVE